MDFLIKPPEADDMWFVLAFLAIIAVGIVWLICFESRYAKMRHDEFEIGTDLRGEQDAKEEN